MTNSSNFVPAADAATLSKLCAASLQASGELIGEILKDFPPEKLEAVERLLAGGGSVGIEATVDGKGSNTIRLVGIEREGPRLVLATIAQPTPVKGQH